MGEQDRSRPGVLGALGARHGRPGTRPGVRDAARGPDHRPARSADRGADRAAVHLEVQRGEAFRELRGRYRRFAFPAAAFALLWYLAYVVAAVTAPGLMALRVAGPLNVAAVAGLGQLASTFLLAGAYARHARLRRDRAALDLRWEIRDRLR
ncbi:DUF485 domain-containing protein [Streptomyces sp. HB2AG]|nr:DUF485 domain-containing protein [Streptomyces sp. HB2AG]MCZ2525480.1 DUF485 domain-containing protein [Streptomyces sp. HB2AG]